MTELTDELYNVLLVQLSVGEVAPYEPMQIRVLAAQSRGTLVQAHNRYVAAWKQLAATLGTPGMPLDRVWKARSTCRCRISSTTRCWRWCWPITAT